MPNREVKPASADGTARKGGRVGRRRFYRGDSRREDVADATKPLPGSPFFCLSLQPHVEDLIEMKIVFLDAATMGQVSFAAIEVLGDLVLYQVSSPEEAITTAPMTERPSESVTFPETAVRLPPSCCAKAGAEAAIMQNMHSSEIRCCFINDSL